MSARHRTIAAKAFTSAEWRTAADALFEASGTTVHVMDFAARDSLVAGSACGFCSLAMSDAGTPCPEYCFDDRVSPGDRITRVMCRAGLPTLISPVKLGDKTVAHLVLGGFVTSTRERRRLYEMQLARTGSADGARIAMKAVTILPRRNADGCLQMAVATATTLVATSSEQIQSKDRVDEMRVLVTASQQVVANDNLDASMVSAMAEEAVALIGGEAGAVLRPAGGRLEIVACTSGWRGTVGGFIPSAKTAAARACETGRPVLTPGGAKGTATLAMPLTLRGRTLGALEVRVAGDKLPISEERLARLDRFGRFIAIALQRDDERFAVERSLIGYAQLNELANALGSQTEIDGVSRMIASVIDKAFTFEIAGLVLTGYGRDEARVTVSGEVRSEELESVLGIVAGRDVAADPFAQYSLTTHRGAVTDEGQVRDDWATLAVELRSGTIDIGYVFVARADGGHYNAQDHALLEGLAAHTGAALGRAALFSRIRDDYAKTIAALSATLDASEHMPRGHSTRVMDYAMLIGEELGLSFEDIEQLRFAGLLHDIGKTGVPYEILLKPSQLSGDELMRVRAHAEFGASIVDQIEFLKNITPIILHHHERWDGEGYPTGLAGESIPLLARILSVADAFDAMSTKKAYGAGKSFSAARKELQKAAGSHFDPRIVAAFLGGLERMELAGATGLLSTASKRPHPRPELLA
ncbi:MAG: HD domain-containing protein [Coriobacteriia bacterium]|nr:HD domain-containing protein [Coriobacteriia bacterium]